MRYIGVYPGVLSGAGMGKIDLPPKEEMEISAILDDNSAPAIKLWFEPNPSLFADELALVRNKAGVDIIPRVGLGTIQEMTATTVNGSPALETIGHDYGTVNLSDFNEYTVLAFIQPALNPENRNGEFISGGQINEGSNEMAWRVNSSGGFLEFNGDTTVRDAEINYYDQSNVVALTYSAEKGVAVHRNGEEKSRNVAFNVPVQTESVRLLGAHRAGTYGKFSGIVGTILILNVDISRTEYYSDAQRLWRYMLDKYGVTWGA